LYKNLFNFFYIIVPLVVIVVEINVVVEIVVVVVGKVVDSIAVVEVEIPSVHNTLLAVAHFFIIESKSNPVGHVKVYKTPLLHK
jgi:hypothetical protein